MPYLFTDRSHGDLGPRSNAAVERRRRRVVDLPWTTVHQVHGAQVVAATGPGHLGDGDAIVTATPGLAIAVRVADCAPIALLADGAVGVVHAGWRGIIGGVIPAALDAMRALGAVEIRAVLGPCIHAECYEFQPLDLDRVASRLGDAVRGTTAWGTPALDVPAAVRAQLGGIEEIDVCTACSSEHWSHRSSGDVERQAVVAWI